MTGVQTCALPIYLSSAQTIQLYDTEQMSITNKTFADTTPSGNNIGSAQVRCFTYDGGGQQGTNTAIYLLHVFNIKMNSGYNVNQTQSVYYNGTHKGIGDLATPGIQEASFAKQLFNFGRSGVKVLRDQNNNNNTEYTYRTKKSYTMYTNGSIVVTLSSAAPGKIGRAHV